MKGDSALFLSSNIKSSGSSYTNGKDYNTANSSNIKNVEEVEYISAHKMPESGTPNSVKQNYDNKGNLTTERYYDKDGNAYLDIDYTNHGNPKTHPHIPHEHKIKIDSNGKMHREKERKI